MSLNEIQEFEAHIEKLKARAVLRYAQGAQLEARVATMQNELTRLQLNYNATKRAAEHYVKDQQEGRAQSQYPPGTTVNPATGLPISDEFNALRQSNKGDITP